MELVMDTRLSERVYVLQSEVRKLNEELCRQRGLDDKVKREIYADDVYCELYNRIDELRSQVSSLQSKVEFYGVTSLGIGNFVSMPVFNEESRCYEVIGARVIEHGTKVRFFDRVLAERFVEQANMLLTQGDPFGLVSDEVKEFVKSVKGA